MSGLEFDDSKVVVGLGVIGVNGDPTFRSELPIFGHEEGEADSEVDGMGLDLEFIQRRVEVDVFLSKALKDLFVGEDFVGGHVVVRVGSNYKTILRPLMGGPG